MKIIEEYASRNEMLLRVPKNEIGAELGVHRGDFSVILHHTTKPTILYLVDLWEPLFPNLGYYRWDNYESLVKLKFNSEEGVYTYRKKIVDWLKSLSDNTLDWVYLDADHTYSNTRVELDELHRVVKPNGLIMGHDFTVKPNAWGTGVPRAVLESIQDGKLKIEAITNEEYPSFLGRNIK